jgi:dCMP deaminase
MKKITVKREKYIRPSWDEYFLGMIELLGARGTCDRSRTGCVIARDKRIVSTGYIGSPPGISHCDDVGHEMHTVINEDGTKSEHCVRTTHAEQNAIAQAARFGLTLDGATLYCHMTPCYTCAKLIITAGIKRVITKKEYHASKRSKDIFKKAGIKLETLNKEVEKYPRQ